MLKKKIHLCWENITNKNNLISFFSGLSLVFAYAPFSLWWLAWFIPCFWLHIINNSEAKQAAKQGFIFGLGWFISGIGWVHVSIDQFGGLPLPVSLTLILLLACYLALYPALACYLTARFSQKRQLSLWLLPVFWLISEYCRGHFLTGFPWLSLGYSQIDSPLAHFAPVIGQVGMTFILLLVNISLYQLSQKTLIKQNSLFLISLSLLTLALAQQDWVQLKDKTTTVALVQGNIKQELKWLPEQEWPTMLKYLDLSRLNADADIIVWPESAVPSFEPAVQDYLDTVNRSATLNNNAIITGILNYDINSQQYFNSLIVLGKKYPEDTQGNYFYNHSNRYYKSHLLPIGEYVPFADLLKPIAPLFNLPHSSFSSGNYQQVNLVANGLHILPLICFEIAFAEQLSANMQESTDLLLTVSNDAWFGQSHGPHQHLEIARMRALEFGRPLLRATNNGITALIDHQGNIIAQLPQFKEAVLKAKVRLTSGTTPYNQWGQFSPWLLALLLFVIYIITTKKSSNIFKD